jgi:hypothetical protein
LVIAAENDRSVEVRRMLERGVSPDTAGPNGDPVLVIAARAGGGATVDVLLAAHASVSAKTRYGDTALMAAALSGRLDIVTKLRRAGATLDAPGWTALIYAATGGHDDVVRYLLVEGADINAASPNGTTALMMAVREGRLSTAELLIVQGADVNRRNENGASALTWATRDNDKAMADRLRRAGARD